MPFDYGGATGKESAYNPLEYGAKFDGTTDDTTPIQNTLNAVPAAGGNVFLPAGNAKYGNLTIPVGVSLFADSQTLTLPGAITTQRFHLFGQPTITAGSALTATNAATVAIAGAPAAAGSATISNPYALWVQAGTARFDGTLLAGSGLINILDGYTGLQTLGNQRFQAFTYWGLELYGRRQAGGPSYVGGAATDPGISLIAGPTSVSAEAPSISVAANTVTATGAIATQRFSLFNQPTITAGTAQTVTNAATLAIAGAPAAAGSATITNPYALWVQAGKARFDGGAQVTGGPLSPPTDAQAAQTGAVYQGSGAPSNTNGNNGDVYFRTDTPGTANQRLYVKSAGAWTGIV